jgi:hypothetical protein
MENRLHQDGKKHTAIVSKFVPRNKKKSVWQLAAEIKKSIPATAWKDVPKDLSSNLDFYLYGKK